MSFTIYPAIDVRDGRVVRLRQGDYGAETRYGDDPLAFAVRHAQAGASWLHLVDLDAARVGGYTLLPLLRTIVAQTGLRVQTGGGVRSRADVATLLDAGAARVVVGSLSVREPEVVAGWLAHFGRDRITVALDARRDEAGTWRLPVHGWTQVADETMEDVLARHADAGLAHLLCTDIARDGMLAGPNLDLYRRLCERHPGLRVQASGGVRDMADLHAARLAGCSGAVLGKALLEGRVDLREALAC